MISVINGDLLSSDAEYIVQQCGTNVNKAMGLSLAIIKKWPNCNFYKESRVPGTIVIKERVIGMMAQINGGKPKNPETQYSRLLLFLQCIEQLPSAKSIAFPFGIGCGIAGGNWDNYYKVINSWSKKHPETQVFIYKL